MEVKNTEVRYDWGCLSVCNRLGSEPQILIAKVQQGDLATVHEESQLLMEHDGEDIVPLDHAVCDSGTHLTALADALPQELVRDGVAPEVRMHTHVLYPEEVLLITDVVEHLCKDESDDLVILDCHETQSAVQVSLEVLPAAGAETIVFPTSFLRFSQAFYFAFAFFGITASLFFSQPL